MAAPARPLRGPAAEPDEQEASAKPSHWRKRRRLLIILSSVIGGGALLCLLMTCGTTYFQVFEDWKAGKDLYTAQAIERRLYWHKPPWGLIPHARKVWLAKWERRFANYFPSLSLYCGSCFLPCFGVRWAVLESCGLKEVLSTTGLIAVWLLYIVWWLGVIVMWHYEMIQPFLKQICVFLWIFIAIAAILSLVLMEAWENISKVLNVGQHTLEKVKGQVADLTSTVAHGGHSSTARPEAQQRM